MRRSSLVAVVLLALSQAAAQGQAAQPPRPIEGVTWYRVNYAKFKPGMADEARKLIYDHFWAVDKEIGREVIPFDYVTGEWDHVVYFPLPGGPSELAFRETELGRKWFETLARREGGREQAAALDKRLSDMVLHTKSELVMRRVR